MTADEISSQSESKHPAVNDPETCDRSSSPVDQVDGPSSQDENPDIEVSEPSDDSESGSEDADFDVESPPATNGIRESSASSQDRPKPTKRKMGVEDDEYIMNNPELYGLRRSGRARTNRQIVESSEDDDSGSDAITARKRRKVTASRKSSKPATPMTQSPSESESDSDTYGARHGRSSNKRKARRQLQPASLAPPPAELRFSTRRAAKVTSYNEDDDDDFLSEEDSEYMTPNYWAAAVDEDAPAIDAVLNHRFKEDTGKDKPHPTKDDFEFFIKWQGKAHYHSTWETSASLSGYRGFRRLENYFRKIVTEEIYMLHEPDIPPEEKEKWNLDRERDADAINDYMHVERVIGTREGDEETEYYVKWKGLFYDSCTWETATLVSEIAQTEIDRFLDRTSQLPISNRSESNRATRSRFERIREQPSYIKFGELRDFQVTGLNFLAYNWCKGNNVILADEMGLGKTVQTVSFLNWLRHDRGQQGPFIVVVPLSTMPSWAETLDNWTPDINYVVYNGNETARNIIKEYELLIDGNAKRAKFNVLLTTYEYILADAAFLSQIKWQFMAVDEAHRLKNRESQLYYKLLEFKAPSRLLITGTPMQNTLGELSALMDFLMPGHVAIDENMDLQSEAAGQKLAELTSAIQPFMLRRTKQKVENDLPPKSEKIIRVELSDVQLEYYKNILTRNYAALNQGATGPKQSLLNIMMELKKASNHPFMFPNAEERILGGSLRRDDLLKALITSSGKMMLLDQLLTKLKKDNHRVLIFSQMVKMLDLLGDYLHLRGHQFQRLDGTIAAGARRMAIDHFNAPGSTDFCFLLSTRAGGLGINLMTADTVILFDSDWNPQADLQAMARAHRIGQKNPVSIYRLVSKETVEEEVLERARNKLMLEFITIQRGVTDKDSKELSDKMARAGRSVNEPTSSEDISRILKRRSQKMFEQSGNQKKLEELDIDSVLENAEEHKTEGPTGIEADGGEEFLKSFEYMDVKIDLEWDDIIPKDQLEQLKAEEKRKADEKYLADVIEQNAPRKRKAASDEREQRAAKKRARDLAAESAALDDEDDSAELDPKRPLNSKEVRNLIRAFLRYGSLENRGDEIVEDAKLVNRDREVLKSTLDEILNTSRQLVQEEQTRVEAMEREANKSITKKDRKAVLFDYQGVKRINAETMLERPAEMRMLKEITESAPDQKNFRVPEASKAAHYSCPWGAREDGMLCVGIVKHGFGAWAQIRDDAELGLSDKLFLEEHRVDKKEERMKGEEKNAKSPGAVHLIRRADYLLSVLKEKTSNGSNSAARRAVENHHKNNRKNGVGRRLEKSTSVSASPAPSLRRGQREAEKSRNRGHSHSEHRHNAERRVSHDKNGLPNKPDSRRKHGGGDEESKHRRRKSEDRQHHHRRSIDNEPNDHTQVLRGLFKPVRESLKHVQSATKDGVKNKTERAKILKIELTKIGHFIKDLLRAEPERSGGSLEERFWEYVAHYWPNPGTPGSNLKSMYERIEAADLETKKAPKQEAPPA
ncbi:putative chromodomain helicase [Xylona heveae TC161]|uniref:Putative chromodomain helicase n=1 Tax=Xylona heveae (strain CBS 132557 / TC161) TaxID=1328760 RepID=A0A165GKJ4_XYLHT|nr:putative chromodomain helicase [Xylona heveae TC161]KZF22304.1 putative chromodomain helicase [Xylona heveae TC161]